MKPHCCDITHHCQDWGREAFGRLKFPRLKFKNSDFVDTVISNIIHDLSSSQNQPLKSSDDKFIVLIYFPLIQFSYKEHKDIEIVLHIYIYNK